VTVWCGEVYGDAAMTEGGELGFDLNFAKFRCDECLFIGLFVLNHRRRRVLLEYISNSTRT
jgi:hypothetical protein